ncbi:MAG: cupin domain-containing protein [bacterium]
MELFNTKELLKHLNQDEKSDIQIQKVTNGVISLFIAELKAGKTLAAHYHNEGDEIYQILAGKGNIEIGELSGDEVKWINDYTVSSGDIFEIKPKIVHRLSNNSDEALQLIFFTPSNHLNEDRIFI